MALPLNRIQVDWETIFSDIPLKRSHENRIELQPETLPIVFVPGFMGTRLLNKKNKIAWEPDDIKFTARNHLKATPQARYKLLIGDGKAGHLRVAAVGDPITSSLRGWESLYQASYRPLKNYLENTRWAKLVELCFDLPIHAFGYDWTRDPGETGKVLAAFIKNIVSHYSKQGKCQHVIVVTHSMGGLVARAASCLHGASSYILGMVHAVQPVTGSPATYWRMKGGMETQRGGQQSLMQYVRDTFGSLAVGSSGAHTTALLSNMAGGLALLPSKLYRDNDGRTDWLTIEKTVTKQTAPQQVGTMPHGDPYKDIYRNLEDVWGLVDPTLLLPAEDPPIARQRYLAALGQAELFHDALGDQMHPNSYHIYSQGKSNPTADTVKFKISTHHDVFQHGKTQRQYQPILVEQLKALTLQSGYFRCASQYYGLGAYDARMVHKELSSDMLAIEELIMRLQPSHGSGDGTVAASSGAHLAQNTDEAKRVCQLANVGHEPCMSDPQTLDFIKESLEDICCAKLLPALRKAGRIK